MVDKVIPNGLNYADLKPQAIENEIKLVRFQPTQTINGAQGNDVIKFMLQGNGFYDPYSAYIRITVQCTPEENEIRFLDRSAHSFINRLVIRSQGQEIERIEQYDVIAAMVNDVLYSTEQNMIHSHEGFPTQYAIPTGLGGAGTVFSEHRRQVLSLLGQGSSPVLPRMLGEPAFFAQKLFNAAAFTNATGAGGFSLINGDETHNGAQFTDHPTSLGTMCSFDYHENGQKKGLGTAIGAHLITAANLSTLPVNADSTEFVVKGQTEMTFIIPVYSGILGVLMPDKKLLPLSLMPLDVEFTLNPHALYSNYRGDRVGVSGSRKYTIKSFELFAHMLFFEQEVHRSLEAVVAENGIFIHFNSFYLAPVTGITGNGVPPYAQINVHFKSINSVHFVFVYNTYENQPCARKLDFKSHNINKLQIRNGTYLIPSEPIESQSGSTGSSQYGQQYQFMIEMYKAWNKMHDPATDGAIAPFNYCDDEFDYNEVSMSGMNNLKNVTDLQKLLALEGPGKFLRDLLVKQGNVGRCQYGISMVGEELGSESGIITGKKAEMPFDVNLTSTGLIAGRNYVGPGVVAATGLPILSAATPETVRNSYMMTFVRADFVVYVRPDLVVTVIGR